MNEFDSDDTPTLANPDGFRAEVLRRTSGSACERARELLCDYTDRSLEHDATTLVRGHLTRCAECHALAATVAELARQLPAMVRLSPDRSLVPAVLIATSGRQRALRRGWDTASAWVRTVMRPRFAMEAAYVGAMLIWLAVALPGSPLHGSTGRVLERARNQPVSPLVELKQPVAQATQKVWTVSRRAWSATGGRGLEFIGSESRELQERLVNTRCARRELRQHGAQIGRAALELDWNGGWSAVREVPRSTGRLFETFVDAGNTIEQDEVTPSTTEQPRAGRQHER